MKDGMIFEIGEKVFYPHHGAGEIKNLEKKMFLGKEIQYYIIKFPLTETTIMVPASNSDSLGLRLLATSKEVKRCFEIISNSGSDLEEDWKARYKKHQDMLKSGTISEVATVIKNLYDRNKIKELSSTEKKIYNNAVKMLVSEIALVIGKNEEDVKGEVLKLLSLRA